MDENQNNDFVGADEQVEPTNEDLEATAAEEVAEETGEGEAA